MIDNKNLFVRIKKNLSDLFNSAIKPKKENEIETTNQTFNY